MYSNDLIQIRAGLVNYIGAMVKASGFEGKAASQIVAAALVEEALKLSQIENNEFDTYVLKPLFRASILVLTQRCDQLAVLHSAEAKNKVRQYREIIKAYEEIIKNI